ncbi:hypothetical protein AB0M28_38245 [Streptomyces sp. NPDC051940]|uniref:hypothetical protein n=1 Tax=Streptomyces sp. NPDC051940 TaxID=3155675 RepID=UPI00341B09FE
MSDVEELLTMEELADEEDADSVEFDEEPDEARDPVDQLETGVELGEPDEFEAMINESEGTEEL